MSLRPPTRRSVLLLALFSALPALASGGQAQEVDAPVQEAYFRAVAEFFEVPLEEVTIISGWDLELDEVPVVLFLSRRAGISPDALIGVRRRGRAWGEVAGRFGIGSRAFHIPLPAGSDLGPLSRAYQEFGRRPPRRWSEIRLEDPEIVSLVNLRVLSGHAGVAPLRVLRAREEAGSFVAAYPRLMRR